MLESHIVFLAQAYTFSWLFGEASPLLHAATLFTLLCFLAHPRSSFRHQRLWSTHDFLQLLFSSHHVHSVVMHIDIMTWHYVATMTLMLATSLPFETIRRCDLVLDALVFAKHFSVQLYTFFQYREFVTVTYGDFYRHFAFVLSASMPGRLCRCFTRSMYDAVLGSLYTQPWHPAWALLPAACLVHGCLTSDVPLLSTGEANFKYHKEHHESGLLYRTIHKVHHLFAHTLPIDSGTESPFEWLFDETHVNMRGVPWLLQAFQFCFVNGHLLGHDCLSTSHEHIVHHEKSKGNYGNSVPTLDKQAGTYLGPDATRFHAHKHFFNDKRRHCAMLNPELLPLGLDEAALGRQLHSALWGRRALWKRMLPTLGLPLAALACCGFHGAAPHLSLGTKLLLVAGNAVVSAFAWQKPFT